MCVYKKIFPCHMLNLLKVTYVIKIDKKIPYVPYEFSPSAQNSTAIPYAHPFPSYPFQTEFWPTYSLHGSLFVYFYHPVALLYVSSSATTFILK